MTASAVSPANSIAAPATAATKAVVNKDDFFKLLIAQLKNQDPTKPMEAAEFTAQLAQFSSLEKLDNVNSTLTSLLSQQGSVNKMQSSQLAGKYVTAYGEQTNWFTAAGRPVDLGYELPGDAARVLITIYDQNGRAVDMVEASNQAKGTNRTTWKNGSARSGSFTYTVSAIDAQGKSLAAQTLLEGQVSAVKYRDNQVYAVVNNREVGVDQILSVRETQL
jgi:flagellar basal-body rod modification protein FlgD